MRPRLAIAKDIKLLDELGLSGARRQLTLVAGLSMVGGLCQAGILGLLAAFGISSIQGHHGMVIHGVHVTTFSISLIAGAMVVIFALSMLSSSYFGGRLAGRALAQARSTVISTFFNGDWSLQSSEHVGHVQQLLAYDCEMVGQLISNICSMLTLTFMVIALLLVAAAISPLITAGILIVGVLLSLLVRPVQSRIRRTGGQLKKTNQVIGRRVTEYTRLAREFRIFGVEQQSEAELDAHNRNGAATFARARILVGATPTAYAAIGLIFAILGFSFITSIDSKHLGASASVLIIILRVMLMASNLQGISTQVSSQSVVLEGLSKDIARFRSADRRAAETLVPRDFSIEVSHLSFSYGDELVLKDLSFVVPQGAKLGILGRSGSGKTTLSQILLGVLEASAGSVSIGGCQPSRIKKSGGSPIALVTQDALLLEGQIGANIDFFRDLDPASIKQAASAAHLDDDLGEMPLGLETQIGPSGGTLSGGQRQRVALARALAGSPRLLLLDEPTSSVDVQSEQAIRRSIDELAGTTTIIISHRIAVVETCDLLMVMEHGRIIDFGTRNDVEGGEAYQKLLSDGTETASSYAD
jgi:ABC-type multidrug transport system fused ATPase/permease subunit